MFTMDGKTSAILRHLVLALFTALGTWATVEGVPAVQDTPVYGGLIAGGIMTVLAWLTPLVNAYGVGAKPQINENVVRGNV
jgi:hypothetical protein